MPMAVERQISDVATKQVKMLLSSLERIMKMECERLQAEDDNNEDDKHVVFVQLPEELRWRVMVLGSSINDINLWIRRIEEGKEFYQFVEIETGTSENGTSPLECCELYFKKGT